MTVYIMLVSFKSFISGVSSVLFGPRTQRGQSPIEHKGNLFVCMSVCSSIPPGASEAGLALLKAGSGLSEPGSGPSEPKPRPHRACLKPHKAWLRPHRAWPRFHRAWPKSHRAWPRSYRGNVEGTADHLLPLSDWLGATKHPHKRDCLSIH